MATFGRCSRNISSARVLSSGGTSVESMEAGIPMIIEEDMPTSHVFDAFAEGVARFNSSFNLSRIANSISMK